jgi:hypothetical protein
MSSGRRCGERQPRQAASGGIAVIAEDVLALLHEAVEFLLVASLAEAADKGVELGLFAGEPFQLQSSAAPLRDDRLP